MSLGDTVVGVAKSDPYGRLRADYPSILSAEQVAEILGLNIRTVYVMAADGRMPASRLPGSRKFHFLLEEIIALLEAHRVSPEPGQSEAANTPPATKRPPRKRVGARNDARR